MKEWSDLTLDRCLKQGMFGSSSLIEPEIRNVLPFECVLRSAVFHKVMVKITWPLDVNSYHSSKHCHFREILSCFSHNVSNFEHRTQRIFPTVITLTQITFFLTVQDVGSLLGKLWEINLVLDEDSEGVSLGQDCFCLTQWKFISFNRTPCINVARFGCLVTAASQDSMCY